MAEDFKVSLSFEYDDTKIQELQNKLSSVGKNNPIKLTLDTSNVTSQLDSIKKQIQSLSNIKINLSGGSGGGGSTGNVTKVTKAYTELISVMKKLNSTEIKIKGLDSSANGNQIQALENLKKHYEDLKNTLESKLSTTQLDSLTPVVDELKLKLQELDGKIEDTKNNLANDIKLKFDSKEFEASLSSISTKYDNLQVKSTEATKATDNFKTAYQQLETAIKSGDVSRIISSYSNYESTLKTVQNQLKISTEESKTYAQQLKETASAQQTLSKSNTLSNNIQTWMNKNTEAAKQYGTQLKDLQNQLKNNTDTTTLQNVSTKFNEIKSAANAAGLTVDSFTTSLKNTVLQVTGLTSIVAVIRKIVNVVEDAVEIVTTLDDSMTQLKIVTGATDSEMNTFLENSISLAKELGQDISDVLDSMTTFSRLGYNLEDSSTLAEYASILSNVADVDLDDATSGLTSVIKGFGIDVSEIEHVSDVLVELGNNYAVSASEILEAFERSSAALSATGTSYEKSAALIAAANAAVQDASTVGTALKSVSARIRGATTELEEMGEDTSDLADGFSKYAEELEALTGFSILEDGSTDTYKDLYDIFEGISGVWDELSDTAQARVSEILGGTRQLQVISSIMNNWTDATNAYEDAMTSVGVATEANAEYMDSITAKVNQLKVALQELASDAINSDLIKAFADFGTTAIEAIDFLVEHLGTLGTILTGAAIVTGIKSIV